MGNILIWSIERNCLLFDIQAHSGKVYDCSWSGDSRLLLSVGTDGRARLWDAAAGSELCEVRVSHLPFTASSNSYLNLLK
jgi:WD40 repeat protein